MSAPLKNAYITCDYGVPGKWSAGHHTGVDYRAAVGTPVFATVGGEVVEVSWSGSWGEAYGLHVVIRSKGRQGKVVHHGYCHLTTHAVDEGQRVARGERIGLSGETGRTFGAHLHYEERLPPHRYADKDREPQFPGWVTRAMRRLRRQRRQHDKAGRR